MKKISFVEKNDALVRLKAPEHFDNDVALFKEVAPVSPLHNDLAKLNEFNKSTIHSKIILFLLECVTIKEIEDNRKVTKEDGTGLGSVAGSDTDTGAGSDTDTGAGTNTDTGAGSDTQTKKKAYQSKKNSQK